MLGPNKCLTSDSLICPCSQPVQSCWSRCSFIDWCKYSCLQHLVYFLLEHFLKVHRDWVARCLLGGNTWINLCVIRWSLESCQSHQKHQGTHAESDLCLLLALELHFCVLAFEWPLFACTCLSGHLLLLNMQGFFSFIWVVCWACN